VIEGRILRWSIHEGPLLVGLGRGGLCTLPLRRRTRAESTHLPHDNPISRHNALKKDLGPLVHGASRSLIRRTKEAQLAIGIQYRHTQHGDGNQEQTDFRKHARLR
jgi:hypothetical protein